MVANMRANQGKFLRRIARDLLLHQRPPANGGRDGGQHRVRRRIAAQRTQVIDEHGFRAARFKTRQHGVRLGIGVNADKRRQLIRVGLNAREIEALLVACLEPRLAEKIDQDIDRLAGAATVFGPTNAQAAETTVLGALPASRTAWIAASAASERITSAATAVLKSALSLSSLCSRVSARQIVRLERIFRGVEDRHAADARHLRLRRP